MPILKVRNLSKSFGDIKAVDGLSFSVNRGDIYGLLGVNGSGKSTTLRILMTLINPDHGDVHIFGKPLHNNKQFFKRKTGALIERPDFYSYLSAYKNLEILLKYAGLQPGQDRIMEVLDLVGLSRFARKRVGIFSQGMKQRLGITQALIHDPELIILDEPVNGLDPHGLVDIRNLILKLNKELNKTIILSSHILREVELVANRMLVIHEGKAVKEGEVTSLLSDYESHVQISVNDQPKAMKVLMNSRFADRVSAVDNNIINSQIRENDIPEINRFLVDHNVEVSAIRPVRNLEEYFISLT